MKIYDEPRLLEYHRPNINFDNWNFVYDYSSEMLFYKKRKFSFWWAVFPNIKRLNYSHSMEALINAFIKIKCPNCDKIIEYRETTDYFNLCPKCCRKIISQNNYTIINTSISDIKFNENTPNETIKKLKDYFQSGCYGLININDIVNNHNFYFPNNKKTVNDYVTSFIEPLIYDGINIKSKPISINWSNKQKTKETLIYLEKDLI